MGRRISQEMRESLEILNPFVALQPHKILEDIIGNSLSTFSARLMHWKQQFRSANQSLQSNSVSESHRTFRSLVFNNVMLVPKSEFFTFLICRRLAGK
jgi:hypothetical protein